MPRPVLTGLADRWGHDTEGAGTERAGFLSKLPDASHRFPSALESCPPLHCFTVHMVHVQIHLLTTLREAGLAKRPGTSVPNGSGKQAPPRWQIRRKAECTGHCLESREISGNSQGAPARALRATAEPY